MTQTPDAVRARAAAVFDLGARLPAQAFRTLSDDAVFCDFAVLLTTEAWPALAALARLHGDRQVDLLVVEAGAPTATAVSLPVGATPDDYWAAVGFDDDGGRDFLDSVHVMANTVAVTGPSGRWGCWGERDPEVAVFRGFPDAAARREWIARYGPCFDAAHAVAHWLPTIFRGGTVPAGYAAALTAHYGAARTA
ncbi:hypothetical protein [Kitasatospora sp. NPDC018619]|uniref:hypothetical protein n=1 Tax=unclassified Kitasatospora TaxID=2633591 RepID=UPI00379A7855